MFSKYQIWSNMVYITTKQISYIYISRYLKFEKCVILNKSNNLENNQGVTMNDGVIAM